MTQQRDTKKVQLMYDTKNMLENEKQQFKDNIYLRSQTIDEKYICFDLWSN